MSRRVQLIRHATGAADAFDGLQGEVTVDTTAKELRLHDGLTAGGIAVARKDLANVAGATTTVDGKLVASDKQKLEYLTLTQAADLDAIEVNSLASKIITDWLTVTQAVDLDAMESALVAALIDIVAVELKTDFISVTQAVDLDTMESDIVANNSKISYTDAAAVAANTAKVSNATHTGDVTGSTALTIAANAVTLAKMATMATASFIGRITAATGLPEILTATQARSVLGLGSQSEVLNTKVLDIGDWNMDTTASIAVAHGLTGANIRSVSALIRHDTSAQLKDLNRLNGSETGAHGIVTDATLITLTRGTSGEFDNAGYDATSFNRGWAVISYV